MSADPTYGDVDKMLESDVRLSTFASDDEKRYLFLAYYILDEERGIVGLAKPNQFLAKETPTTQVANNEIGKFMAIVEKDIKAKQALVLEASANGIPSDKKLLIENRIRLMVKAAAILKKMHVADWNARPGNRSVQQAGTVRRRLFSDHDTRPGRTYAAAAAAGPSTSSGPYPDIDRVAAFNDFAAEMLAVNASTETKITKMADSVERLTDHVSTMKDNLTTLTSEIENVYTHFTAELMGVKEALEAKADVGSLDYEDGQIIPGNWQAPLGTPDYQIVPNGLDINMADPPSLPNAPHKLQPAHSGLGTAKPNMPKYTEGKTDIDNYFSQLERYFKLCNTDPALWIDMCMMSLPTFTTWYEQHAVLHPDPTWQEFKQTIKAFALGENTTANAMSKLLSAHQGSYPIANYCQYFLNLSRDAKVSPTESWLVHKFLLGLSDATLRRSLSSNNGQPWSSITQLIQKITTISSLEVQHKSSKNNANAGYRTSRFGRQGTANGISTSTAAPNNRPKVFAAAMANNKPKFPSGSSQKFCLICRMHNHDTMECNKLRNQQANKRPAENTEDTNGKAPRM
jgi:hypothetical protein